MRVCRVASNLRFLTGGPRFFLSSEVPYSLSGIGIEFERAG